MKRSAIAISCTLICSLVTGGPTQAQTINPGDATSGTVIIDGNDFMQAQHMSNLITSGDALTQRNLQMLMQPAGGGMGGGAGMAPPPEVSAQMRAAIGRKAVELDKFAPSEPTIPHDLARKLAHGDDAKRAKLESSLTDLLAKFNAQAKMGDKHYVSVSYMYLLMEAYAIEQGPSAVTDAAKMEGSRIYGAMSGYVGALQLANGRAATDREKQRTYDVVAISTEALDSAYDQATKRNDPELKAKVTARAAGTIKSLFGCPIDSMSMHDCVAHIGLGSAKYTLGRGDAILKL